jgi:hypothetical protein
METATYPFRQIEVQLNERVQDLLSRLTLDEKVTLMPQYQAAIERLGVGGYKHGTEGAHGISWLGQGHLLSAAERTGMYLEPGAAAENRFSDRR